MRAARRVTSALLFVGAAGCGSASPAKAPEPLGTATDIAEVNRVQCGTCHPLVGRGERSREALESALERHRRLVHLTEPDWGLLVGYLASTKPP
jgi:hypothetical protein